MTALELKVWASLIERVHAEEILRERGGTLSAEELFRAVWLATGDRRQAERERLRRALDEMRAGAARPS